jgi:hypothetical protein
MDNAYLANEHPPAHTACRDAKFIRELLNCKKPCHPFLLDWYPAAPLAHSIHVLMRVLSTETNCYFGERQLLGAMGDSLISTNRSAFLVEGIWVYPLMIF